ncbi:hypothetical protein AB3Y40_06935 [Yoonia sp. R2331]|uniref:hypothetical protein n=1 Tax=Yoonia sp. R2331 TaxID=3237238 RepID=UPI0034E61874
MGKSLGTVISLFDHSGTAVAPWAAAGYDCYCLDILHETYLTDGNVTFIPADLDPGAGGWMAVASIMRHAKGRKVLFAWPPCDDLTGSGAKHFERKRKSDPGFQLRAVRRATLADDMAREHGFRSLIENPIGKLCTMWRKPDVIWNPSDFGGYLPPDDVHPTWPKYIAARDAYPKKTGAWIGGGFVWPEQKPVVPEILERVTKSGRTIRGSRQFMYLGGSSRKTKEIRNLTPRGAAQAFFEANAPTRPGDREGVRE